jgi:hypothetical protein
MVRRGKLQGQRRHSLTGICEGTGSLHRYVIMHELCHVRIPNPGRRFYELLGQMMPDWELRKARLERAGR